METSKTSESDRGIYRVGDHDKRTNQHSAYEISRVIDALHAASSAGNRFKCEHFYFCLWKQHEKCSARDCFFRGVYNHDYCIFFFLSACCGWALREQDKIVRRHAWLKSEPCCGHKGIKWRQTFKPCCDWLITWKYHTKPAKGASARHWTNSGIRRNCIIHPFNRSQNKNSRKMFTNSIL